MAYSDDDARRVNRPHVYPFALNVLLWPFEDPSACQGSEMEKIAAFRTIRDAIDARLRAWLSDPGPDDGDPGAL